MADRSKRCRLLDEYAQLAARTTAEKPVLDFLGPVDWARLKADPRTEALRDKEAPQTNADGAPQMVLFQRRVIITRTRSK